ncbi:MAG: transferase [Firmicutes bacterium HGW-Firmicutes-1]|jgi:sugar O-acyltransferase (sialic acid O-acetyltransferase NeuD family)|nr:MAG: transferase [Firmicutes bacterium HGW-Firmicutes-1]
MEDIVVFGSGGHAKVVIDIIEKQKLYNLIGLIDPYKEINDRYFDYRIIGNSKDYSILNKVYGGIVAIGDNWIRFEMSQTIDKIAPNFQFITCIHPNATIGRLVRIGEGTVIMAGAVVNSDTTIGKGCIINTLSSIDHDCNVGDFTSIAPNSSTGGRVIIQNYTAIGIGTNIIHNIHIGEHTVVGAGSTVIDNLPSYVLAFGTPCKVIKERWKGDKYL